MKITIEAEAKEIAGLVSELQSRSEKIDLLDWQIHHAAAIEEAQQRIMASSFMRPKTEAEILDRMRPFYKRLDDSFKHS